MTIRASEELGGAPKLRFPDKGSHYAEITYPVELTFSTAEDVRKYLDWLQDAIVSLLSRLFLIRDVQSWMEKIAGEERAFARALMLGDVLTLNRNVFGDKPKIRLTDWIEPEAKEYARLRDSPWSLVKSSEGEAAGGRRDRLKPGSGPPPADLFDSSRLKHTERRIVSPIDLELWDRAKWCGTLFGWTEGAPPLLGIGFENEDASIAIFKAWRERWELEDAHDALRVAIITGLSTRNPAHYAVTIGPNLNRLQSSGARLLMTVSRINRMEPASSYNLDRFLSAFRRFGSYFLMPAQMGSSPCFLQEFYLAKRQLDIRKAWQIGENDLDASALRDDDDPIIPPMMPDPPVNKALEQIRAFRQRQRGAGPLYPGPGSASA